MCVTQSSICFFLVLLVNDHAVRDLLLGEGLNYTYREFEIEPYDGYYNNLGAPDLGAVDKPLLRRWPAAYEDGTYLPAGTTRPNPLELSQSLLSGPIGTKSKTGKNTLLVFFGQQIVEEILDAQRPGCPPEYFNIPIPPGHKYRVSAPNHTVLPFLRSRYDQRTGLSPNNPRQQLNEITPFIDGGLVYGTSKQWADQLRTYANGSVDQDGKLASSHGGLFPEYNRQRLPMANPPPPFKHAEFVGKHETYKVTRFFKLGNPRGNENTFLLTFGILWFRWHNRLASEIKQLNPGWSSEKIFNEARKWLIATQQNIIVYEWLPSLLGQSLKPYSGYDPSVNPQIDQFFQSAAFRFGHTLVVPGVYLRDYVRNNCSKQFKNWGRDYVRTCNAFWRPQDAILTKMDDNETFIDIDRILMGMSVQMSEEEDHKIVEDLRENVFGPLEFPRRDLMALNIQRGRDHGLPDFNSARRAYGLDPVTFDDFDHLNASVKEKFRLLYNNSMEEVDVWVGGILETKNGSPGELFRKVIMDQFERIRNGDRFWFENTANGLFTPEEIRRIKNFTMYKIITTVTGVTSADIQEKVFRVPTTNNTLVQTCGLQATSCGDGVTCFHLPVKSELDEKCVTGGSYDYFSGSETSFIVSFLGIGTLIAATAGFAIFLIGTRKMSAVRNEERDVVEASVEAADFKYYAANEWITSKESRGVLLKLDKRRLQITVESQTNGNLLRILHLGYKGTFLTIIEISDNPTYVILQALQCYDLVLQFPSNYTKTLFLGALKSFAEEVNIRSTNTTLKTLKLAWKKVITKQDRQKQLDLFFRVVFAQAFKIELSVDELLKVDKNMAKIIASMELTITEFAEALRMSKDSAFVNKMFALIDKDRNNLVSFREFIDLLVIFANGNEEDKAKLLFDMYDINSTGYLTVEEFEAMIQSFLETVSANVNEKDIKHTIKAMIKAAGIRDNKHLAFKDFLKIIENDIVHLRQAKLGFANSPDRNTLLDAARNTIESIYGTTDELQSRFQGDASTEIDERLDIEQEDEMSQRERKRGNKTFNWVLQYTEAKYKLFFWISVYTLVLLGIFAERAYYYSVEREHSGLRRIAGYGVTVTRGAASAMMFTYSSLFVTMSRNLITFLRDTRARDYFPFDDALVLHKYIAYWALFFTVIHVIGHAFNFYHISTQTADDLTCLFRNFFHATHEFPKFDYWLWQTITGVTGVSLVLHVAVIYIFAQPKVRQTAYNWFWSTHSTYPIFFILMFIHGMGRLIQPPFTYYFALGPIIVFTIDTLISVSRKKIQINVIKADILPSYVTRLEFRKPDGFQYKSGQWVRIACLALSKNEFHPFTLSSSPHEENLTVHIRTVGPWTKQIRNVYSNAKNALPSIYLDGPYGEGSQDWNNYGVSVLVGAGIGVTPFASILKDIVHRRKQIKCKKVYFIWVSRTQNQFEWLIDTIRGYEAEDTDRVVSTHIFITQFYQKFDLRTVLLYICERHYQKICNRSLFTNLRAVTHFGRPNFLKFLNTVQSFHKKESKIGVFSCGPPSAVHAVAGACKRLNAERRHTSFLEHHYKSF